jgi:hypothetical protein
VGEEAAVGISAIGFAGVAMIVVAWVAWRVSATVTRYGKVRSDAVFARSRARTLQQEARGQLWRMVRLGVVVAATAVVLIGMARLR